MERIMPKILLLCLITQITLIQAQTQTPTNNLIDFICKQTSDYKTCSVALNSDPRSGNLTTIKDLANLFATQVMDKGSQISTDIEGLVTDPKTKFMTKAVLKNICQHAYSAIRESALEAVGALAKQNYKAAKVSMGEIPDMVEACESSFQKVAHVQSPIADDSKSMDALCKVAYDVFVYKASHPTPP